MKKLYILFLMAFMSLSYGQDLVITGIIDGPITGGVPKAMELYVVNDITDLSIYSLERAPNGNAPDGVADFTFPATSVSSGDYLYVSKEIPEFTNYFGFAPDYETTAIDVNGDDAVILYKSGVLEDVYGVPGTDGTGESWEHLDGWAYRNNTEGPNATFDSSEWTFSGINAVDGCATNAACASVFPVGTYMSVLSVDEFNLSSINVFPNPVSSNFVTIRATHTTNLKIDVYDVLGKKFPSRALVNDRLDISNLKAGIYILKISSNESSTTKKLVVR